jgi:acetolactate synthase small subunit
MSVDQLAKTFTTHDPDHPDPATTDRVVCYSIRADAESGVLPRVLHTLAKRDLVPERLHADRIGQAGEDLSIDLQVAGLDAHTGGFVAASLRQIVGVTAVLTSEKST